MKVNNILSLFFLEKKTNFSFYKKNKNNLFEEFYEFFISRLAFKFHKNKVSVDFLNFIFDKIKCSKMNILYKNTIIDCDFIIIPFFCFDDFFDKKIYFIRKNKKFYKKIYFLIEDESLKFNSVLYPFLSFNNYIFFKKKQNFTNLISTLFKKIKFNIYKKDYFKKIMLVGKTNVGKSSICNFLLQKYKFFTSNKPNITKDFFSEKLFDFEVFDSPGFTKKKKYIGNISDVYIFLFVIDFSFDKKDEKLFDFLKKSGKKIIICLNKIDKLVDDRFIKTFKYLKNKFNSFLFIKCSCHKKIGFGKIVDSINYFSKTCNKFFYFNISNFVSNELSKKTLLRKNIINIFSYSEISRKKILYIKKKIFLKFKVREGFYFLSLKILKNTQDRT